MKYLFFVMPAHGHMNPTLAVAEELVRRGEEVIYYTTEEFAESVKNVGAKARLIPPHFNPVYVLKQKAMEMGLDLKKRDPQLMLHFLKNIRLKAHELVDQVKAEEADAAVYDPMCTWGHEIIQTLRLPAATFMTSFAMKKGTSLMDYIANRVPEVSEIIEVFTVEEELNIVTIPKEFQIQPDAFDDRYLFVGPLISRRNIKHDLPLNQLANEPVLYISLGSILSNVDFYKCCIEAFGYTSWKVVLNIGRQTNPKDIEPIPDNFIVRQFVPQLEVLKVADVFITHGGMNSAMESLWFGVLPVVVPQSSDQPIVAEQIKRLGLGEVIQPDQISADTLIQAVNRAMDDKEMKQRLCKMKESLHQIDGIALAVDHLQKRFRRS
ncbi:hypothetical protein HT574_18375 [Parageobacillus sp. VR-IP]|uniref:nucleotide disphospho-sugar-binding domain-containing protein n=1 Tax=Parageobacillus sp. VR-IP TaxID=2742205 RepID=UPI0015820D36|nr:nucleotide disphospho-sugar-binding domain-containing protein [Parageobacillus sp. VR-IP]NUK31959.1 hypothetical protein [Parageobacillus sp. VR-IP]